MKSIKKNPKVFKPFKLKKALKGQPFTWIEQPAVVIEAGRTFEVAYLVGECRSASYPEGHYVAQLQSLGDEYEDTFIVKPIEDFEQYCRMLTKLELLTETGIIPTSTTIN